MASANEPVMDEHTSKRQRLGKTSDDAFFVPVNRDPLVQESRMKLPVCMYEQEIIEAIRANDVVLVIGETGSGKTTQVPQFLVENGFGDQRNGAHAGLIVVTQPRRIAASACARRVAYEMGSRVGGMVGFHVRHNPEYSGETRVKFMTDGILLREIQHDMTLSRYSAVVVDEAHERTLNTDILLALLSRAIVVRRELVLEGQSLSPLKLVIMSATLDVDGVFMGPGGLFPDCAVVKVPARQYPVTVHFERRTNPDYVEAAYKKVVRIHRKLPPGGILVFLTGQEEVIDLVERLRRILDETAWTLPFYALLDDVQQKRVFALCATKRKIIVATNVAETSVTIPGISYVVDSGRVKEKVYRGCGAGLLTRYDIVWASKASAEQRCGRAGRTGPGHCYRLYSSAVYNDEFRAFREAEILRVPADMVVLRLRSMGIRHVLQFPFPTKPPAASIADAESLLANLGAIAPLRAKSVAENANAVLGVTPIGFMLAKLPVSPRFGRMILAARAVDGCVPYASRAVALLSVGDVLVHSPKSRILHAVFRHPQSDVLTQLRALCAVEHAGYAAIARETLSIPLGFVSDEIAAKPQESSNGLVGRLKERAMRSMCEEYAISFKTCIEALAVAEQLEDTVASIFGTSVLSVDSTRKHSGLPPMTDEQETGLLRAILCGFPDRIARRMTIDEAAAMQIIPRKRKVAFVVSSTDDPAFLDSFSSVHLDREHEFVCYGDILQLSSKQDAKGVPESLSDEFIRDDYDDVEDCARDDPERSASGRVRSQMSRRPQLCDGKLAPHEQSESRLVLKHVSIVKRQWLAVDAASICRYSIAQNDRVLRYDPVSDKVVRGAEAVYGPRAWQLGQISMDIDDFCELKDAMQARSRAVYCAFAAALLRGHVFSELRGLARDLMGKPEDVLGPLGGRRSTELVTALTVANVRSRQTLVKIWTEPGRDQFLRKEYLAWIQDRERRNAEAVWEQVVQTHVKASRNAKTEVQGEPLLLSISVNEGDDGL